MVTVGSAFGPFPDLLDQKLHCGPGNLPLSKLPGNSYTQEDQCFNLMKVFCQDLTLG